MKVCRICLAADRKMFALDTKHKIMYENTTGISVPPTDRLPKYICWECRHLMSKYFAFEMKAATSHRTLMEILTTNKTVSALETHRPKSTLTRTNIFYLNLDGVERHDDLEEMVEVETFKSHNHIDVEVKIEVDDKPIEDDVMEYENEADFTQDEETTFLLSSDTGEINVESEVVDKPIDNIIEDTNVKTKVTFENVRSIKNTKESIEEFNNIEIAEEIVENDNDIENDTGEIIAENKVVDKPIDNIIEDKNVKTKVTFENVRSIKNTKESIEEFNNIEIAQEIVENDNVIENDTGEINVESEVHDKPIDNIIEDTNVKTKVTFENVRRINNTKESIEEYNNIDIAEESVENNNDIENDIGEINVGSEVHDKPIDRIIEDTNVKTKEAFENVRSIKNTKESIEEFNNINIAEESVENNNDIEVIEKSVVNFNDNESLDNLPRDYTDDDEIESFVSCKNDDRISSKNISSEFLGSLSSLDETSKSKKKLELDKILQKATALSKDIDTLNSHMELHSEIPADGPHCERCDLSFASQEAFNDHKKCSTNHADKRTIKINPRFKEPMVVNGVQFTKLLRVELRKYYAPPEYAPLFGAPFKKPNADSQKEKNNSKASNEESVKTVNLDTNISELFKKTEHLEEAKDVADCTETVVGDKNNSVIETSQGKFICNDCGQQFHKKRSIISHIKTKHVKNVQIRSKKCAYSSVTKDKLQKHSKLNYEKRKYFCNVCNNGFTSKIILKRHKKRCDIKNNVSNTHSTVKRHMRTHTGKKTYSCAVCNKQFTQTSSLNIHRRLHTGEKPYSCTVCNKAFTFKGNLIVHERSHTGDKPYLCTVCNKPFTLNSNLIVHMRTHTDEKPYPCTVCNKQFNRIDSLNRHMRTHTGEKRYSCTVCNKQFIQGGNLMRHMRTRHTGETRYSCTVCNKLFTKSSKFNRHMRTHC